MFRQRFRNLLSTGVKQPELRPSPSTVLSASAFTTSVRQVSGIQKGAPASPPPWPPKGSGVGGTSATGAIAGTNQLKGAPAAQSQYSFFQNDEADFITEFVGPLHLAARQGQLDLIKVFLDTEPVNAKTEGGWTPLHYAATAGHLHVVKFLIERGASVHDQSAGLWTPLHSAAAGGDVGCVEFLLAKGAMWNALTKRSRLPLHIASKVKKAPFELMKVLIDHGLKTIDREGGEDVEGRKRAYVDARDDRQRTALHFAAGAGSAETVEYLLKNGAHPDSGPESQTEDNSNSPPPPTPGKKGPPKNDWSQDRTWRPLHFAAGAGFLETTKILVQHGAKLGVRTTYGWTPLHCAVKWKHVETVKFLLASGADPSAVEPSKPTWSPLHLASFASSLECVKVLLDAGADHSAKLDVSSWTPIFFPIQSGNMELLKVLIDKGADVKGAKTVEGRTALHLAVENGHLEMVKYLVETAEVDINAKSVDKGNTALHAAFQRNLPQTNAIISYFLDLDKLDLDSINTLGYTSVHFAVRYAKAAAVKKLIERKANLNVANRFGWTPLHYAAKAGFSVAVDLLLAGGAEVNPPAGTNKPEVAAPLALALQTPRTSAVALKLYRVGASVTSTDADGRTPVHMAANQGLLDMMRAMLKKSGKDVASKPDKRGWTPLHIAAVGRHGSLVPVLLDAAEDLEAFLSAKTNNQGWTAMHCAAQGGSLEVVTALFQRAADPTLHEKLFNAKDAKGWTPLHHAVELGNLQVVQYLLGQGVTKPTSEGYLHLALERSRYEVANMLLQHGASLEEFDSQGRLPIHVAAMKGQLPYVSHFVDKGKVPVDAKTKTTPEWTALHMAWRYAQDEVASYLLAKGANSSELQMFNSQKRTEQQSYSSASFDDHTIMPPRERPHKIAYPESFKNVIVVENPDASDPKLLEACAQLRNELERQQEDTGLPVRLIGLDMEWSMSKWTPNGEDSKTALLQLCTGKVCAMFRLCNHSTMWFAEKVEDAYQVFPPALRSILEDESCLKVGVGSVGDQEKLLADYGIWAGPALDSNLCVRSFLPHSIGLAKGRSIGLRALTLHFTKRDLTKYKPISTSHWATRVERLSLVQVEYAADDARASLETTTVICQKGYGQMTRAPRELSETTDEKELAARARWTPEEGRRAEFIRKCRETEGKSTDLMVVSSAPVKSRQIPAIPTTNIR